MNKEEELKHLHGCEPWCYTTLGRLPKLSSSKTSKRTSAPAAETSMALATVGFVGTYTGVGETRVSAASITSPIHPGA